MAIADEIGRLPIVYHNIGAAIASSHSRLAATVLPAVLRVTS